MERGNYESAGPVIISTVTGIHDHSLEISSFRSALLLSINTTHMPPYFPITLDPNTPFMGDPEEARFKDYLLAQYLRPHGRDDPHYEGSIEKLQEAYNFFNDGGPGYEEAVVELCTALLYATDCPILVRLEALQLRASVGPDKIQSAKDRARALCAAKYLPVCCALVDRAEEVKSRTATILRLTARMALRCRKMRRMLQTRRHLAAQQWQAKQRALRLDPCGSGDRRSLKQKARRILDEIDGHRPLGEEENFLEAVSLGQDVTEGAQYFLDSLSNEDRAQTPAGVLICAVKMIDGSWR